MIVTVIHKDGRKETIEPNVLVVHHEVIVRPGQFTLVITDAPEKEKKP